MPPCETATHVGFASQSFTLAVIEIVPVFASTGSVVVRTKATGLGFSPATTVAGVATNDPSDVPAPGDAVGCGVGDGSAVGCGVVGFGVGDPGGVVGCGVGFGVVDTPHEPEAANTTDVRSNCPLAPLPTVVACLFPMIEIVTLHGGFVAGAVHVTTAFVPQPVWQALLSPAVHATPSASHTLPPVTPLISAFTASVPAEATTAPPANLLPFRLATTVPPAVNVFAGAVRRSPSSVIGTNPITVPVAVVMTFRPAVRELVKSHFT
jgi:hypothetical protein